MSDRKDYFKQYNKNRPPRVRGPRKEYFKQYNARRPERQRGDEKELRLVHAVLREVVGWDGEGVTVEGADVTYKGEVHKEHVYNMLVNSRGDILERPSIGTKEAFDFFIDHAGTPGPKGTLNIMFVHSYDATMILKELSDMKKVTWYPRNAKEEKITGKEIIQFIIHNDTDNDIRFRLGDHVYGVHYRERKHFIIYRYKNPEPGKKGRFSIRIDKGKGKKRFKKNADKICLWDVSSVYNSSFVVACEREGILLGDELKKMSAMKNARDTFTEADRERVREYCVTECNMLSLLYKKRLISYREAGLMPARHDGPGAVATVALKTNHVKEHIQEEPEEIAKAVACAYFGGRVEMCFMGHGGPVYGNDICSAYPWAMTTLPSLKDGTWENTNEVLPWGIYHVQFRFPTWLPWYPLPYRNKGGQILFAYEGEGWYHTPEILAAQAFLEKFRGESDAHIHIMEGWIFKPKPGMEDVRPLAFLENLYKKRKEWDAINHPGGAAIKLAICSVYGQIARQVGGTREKFPAHYSLPWAGMITSAVRARMVMVGLEKPDEVIAFATDGIFTLNPLSIPETLTGKGLGQWEGSTTYEKCVWVQAGVYWLFDGEKWKAKFRGFDKKFMKNPEHILDAWERDETTVKVKTTRFLTYSSALTGKERWKIRGRWITNDRRLSLLGGSHKKMPHEGKVTGLHPLVPQANDDYSWWGQCSYPYDSLSLKDEEVSSEDELSEILEIEDTQNA